MVSVSNLSVAQTVAAVLVAATCVNAVPYGFMHHNQYRPMQRFFSIPLPHIPLPHIPLAGDVVGGLSDVANGVGGIAGGAVTGTLNTVGGAAGGALDSVGGVAGGLHGIATGDLKGGITNGFNGAVGGVVNGVTGAANGIAGGATDIAGGVAGVACGSYDILTSPFKRGKACDGGDGSGSGGSGGVDVGAGGSVGGSGGSAGAPPAPASEWKMILHSEVATTYVTWSYTDVPVTAGLTWGVQCKGVGCNIKTGFVGAPDAAGGSFMDTSKVVQSGWTEHSPLNGRVNCPKNTFMSSMVCKDAACMSMNMRCSPLKAGFAAKYGGPNTGGLWTSDYSMAYCDEGEYMDGIQCIGSCTKSFNIFCSKVGTV